MKKRIYSRKKYLSQPEIYKTLWTEDGGFDFTFGWTASQAWSTEILWNNIFELYRSEKHWQYNFKFMNKIGGRSNTAHPPITIAISYFQFILFLSLASYRSYGQRWYLDDTGLIWLKEHNIFIKFCFHLFYSCLL